MRVYLVQHGEAKREEEDPARPLTEEGRREVEDVARFLAELGVRVDRILHSGKLRAAQTADILGGHLKPVKGVEKADGLEPLADPEIWAKRLEEADEELMLVGHLPHLARLVSLLTVGKSDVEVMRFRYGAVACLEKTEKGRWSILWIVRPDTIPESFKRSGGSRARA